MALRDVVEIVKLLNQHEIEFYIDGGWGVDALLGEQTRPHTDLDIAIHHKDSLQVRALLEARGYSEVNRDDSSDFNFVLKRQSVAPNWAKSGPYCDGKGCTHRS